MLKFIKTYPLTLLVIFAIFYLSFFTPPKIKTVEIPFYDKWGHICMYLGLAGMVWFEYLRNNRQAFKFKNIIAGGIVFPVLLGGLIELGQKYLTDHREGDWADFAANSLGVLLANLGCYYLLRPLMDKWAKRKAESKHNKA